MWIAKAMYLALICKSDNFSTVLEKHILAICIARQNTPIFMLAAIATVFP